MTCNFVGDRTDEILARWHGEGTAWYLTDHIGTICDLVDAAGELINTITYDGLYDCSVLRMNMTTAYSVSDDRSIDMPNIDADLIIKHTEKHLPEGYDKDEELRALFELGGLMNVVVLDDLRSSVFMTFYNASTAAFDAYRNRGPRDDGKIPGWFERICEEWDELLKLMRDDPRFQPPNE